MHRTPPDRTPREPRPITADMAADAAHAGRFLRMFGGIFGGVGATLTIFLGVFFTAVGRLAAVLPPIGMCLSFTLAGAIVYLLGVRSSARAIDLFRRGTEAPARVTSVGLDYMVRVNKRNPYRVDYAFDVGGVLRAGFVRLWVDDPPRVSIGDDVTVVYDADKPSHNLLLTRVTDNEKLRVGSAAATEAAASEADTRAEVEALSESEASRREAGGPRRL